MNSKFTLGAIRLFGLLVLTTFITLSSFGQTSGTYNLLQNGTTFTLTGVNKTFTTGCSSSTGSDSYNYWYGNLSTVYGTACTGLAYATYSPSITTTGTSTFYYVQDRIHHTWSGAAADCLGSTNNYTNQSSLTVNVVANISATSTLSSSMCSSSSSVNLYSYVNLVSGVTFYVDGSAIAGSTFTPSSYSSNASHVVTASYTYDNDGTKTVSLGTVLILPVSLSVSAPSNYTTCQNGNASFTATASGSNLSYQWQEFGAGGAWSSLSDGGVYSGTHTSTLILTSVTSSFSGYQYRCVVSNGCTSTSSSAATLNFYGQVGIISAPSNSQICSGGNTTFSASGSGNGTITFQWQESTNGGSSFANVTNSGIYSGATTGTLTLTGATSSMNNYQYRCVMADACGSVNQNTTSAGTLTFYSNAGVTSHPSNVNACVGGNANFTVSGSGSGSLSFQWQESNDGGTSFNNITNGGIYSGATSTSLTLTGIPTASYNNYKYRCKVTNLCTTATSNAATLSAVVAPAVTSHPSNVNACVGGNASFSATASGGGTLTFQWQESTDGGTTFSNLVDGGIYSGATSASLTLTGIPTAAYDGNRYRCRITNSCTNVLSNAATLSAVVAPAVTSHPSNVNACVGGNASFSVTASGGGTLTFQWQESTDGGTSFNNITNGGIYSGATSASLTVTGIPTASYNNYKYRCRITNTCTTATSNAATLSAVVAPAVTSHPSNVSACVGGNASFSVAASGGGTLTFQWQESTDGGTSFNNITNGGIYSGATSASLTLTGIPSTAYNNYKYRCKVTNLCTTATSNAATLSAVVTPSVTSQPGNANACVGGNASFSVTASGGGTLAYQWQESNDGGTTFNNITNGGIYSGATSATLTLTGVPTSAYNGYRYRVVVSNSCTSVTSNSSTLSTTVAPTITSDPAAKTVCSNTSASFSVSASGTSLGYQWQFSLTGAVGTFSNISGATSATYTDASATSGDAGYYRCIVSNNCASSVSGSAYLTVNASTSISSQPVNKAVCPDGSTTFSLLGAGTGLVTYQWQESTNGGTSYINLSNGGKYSGVTTSALSLTSIVPGMNDYRYRAVVHSDCGNDVTSSGATLTVNVIPAPPTAPDVSRCGDGALSSTAASSATSPTFKWYNNASDVSSIFTGTTYDISNLTVSQTKYVTVTSNGCESIKEAVVYTRITPQSVPLGGALSLCVGQGAYNLEADITDPVAVGSNFNWTANSTNFTSKIFDPSVGAGTYPVSYDPPTSAKLTPYCYVLSTRNVTVISSAGEGGLTFKSPLVSGGNTVNTCVGNAPIVISDFPSTLGGTWSTVSGSGISNSGSATVFTPTSSNYTATTANVFRYTVNISGCSASKDLNIFVKDNQSPPSVTGVPSAICPGTTLSLKATVSDPGTFSFQWFKAGVTKAFDSLSNPLLYPVVSDETLYVRSINTSFGCASTKTPVNIVTPFQQGIIQVDKNLIDMNNKVHFTYNGGTTGNSFGWDFGDGFVSTEVNPVHYYYSPGTYDVSLKITSTLGCSSTVSFSSITVNGTPIDIITGVEPNTGTELKGISMYPVPFSDVINVSAELTVDNVVLLDLTGKEVHNENPEKKEFEVRPAGLTPGIYLMRIYSGSKFTTIKIVKQ